MCFSYIAELIDGKAAREVHDRYKQLKLKHFSTDEAKAYSASLHVALRNEAKDIRIGLGLLRMLQSYSGNMPSAQDLTEFGQFLQHVYEEVVEHEKAKEDAILFGSNLDMLDIKNGTEGYRVVPTTRKEFKIV
jgi:hypothetical protein